MKSKLANCLLVSILFLLIGYVEIQSEFKPIGSSIFLIIFFILFVFRLLIFRHSKFSFLNGTCLMSGLFIVALNISVGIYLNQNVDAAAKIVVDDIYNYKEKYGAFPNELRDISTSPYLDSLRRGRIQYGAHYYYIKDKGEFGFGYERYLLGDKRWDFNSKKFVDAID